MDFKRKDGMIYLGDENAPDAYIQYDEIDGDKKILNCTHTVVNPSLEGKGIGSKLVEELANYARENDYKVIAGCSFALSKLQSSEYDDIRA